MKNAKNKSIDAEYAIGLTFANELAINTNKEN